MLAGSAGGSGGAGCGGGACTGDTLLGMPHLPNAVWQPLAGRQYSAVEPQ
jgi:hypothetical protein